MTKYTAEELENITKEYDEGRSYGENFYEELHYSGEIELPIGKAIRVSSEGGYEGGGDYMDVVFRIGDQLFRKQGFYSSYDFNEWDGDLEEVEEYQELVTKYRSI